MATNPHYLASFTLVFCAGCMLGIGCAVQFPHLARRLLGKFCIKTEGLAILGELRETAKARQSELNRLLGEPKQDAKKIRALLEHQTKMLALEQDLLQLLTAIRNDPYVLAKKEFHALQARKMLLDENQNR